MSEFDSYINTIIGGLRVNKKKKEEIAEEFKDHLESLKSEFTKNGFTEDESINRAIDRFGESNDIKKKLQKSFKDFRYAIFVAVIALIMITLRYIPVAGVNMSYREYNPDVGVISLSSAKWIFMFSVLILIPVGYFLFKRVLSKRNLKAL